METARRKSVRVLSVTPECILSLVGRMRVAITLSGEVRSKVID